LSRQRERRNRIPATSKALESLKSLRCSFPTSASGTWRGANRRRRQEAAGGPRPVLLSTIRNANLHGEGVERFNALLKKYGPGLTEVQKWLYLSALGVLTVFAKESHDGRLQAVYSRASYVERAFGEAEPPTMSQFYGDCEIGSR
jgi:hypothetical protein